MVWMRIDAKTIDEDFNFRIENRVITHLSYVLYSVQAASFSLSAGCSRPGGPR